MVAPSIFFFFFFSSRRRHPRFDCDSSSDVCSSDLCSETDPVTRIKGMSFRFSLAIASASRDENAGREWSEMITSGLNLSSSVMKCDLDSRSEEHTSELQSQSNLVCRLLLEKKKKKK